MANSKVIIINEVNEYDFDELLLRAVNASLDYEKISSHVDISISIVSEEDIHSLNAEHRDIDRATDVLSFPMLDLYDVDNKDEIISENSLDIGYKTTLLGDVVLCFDIAKRQADEYGHSLERELAFLTVHSVLHLLGYDHMNEEDDLDMRRRQRDIMDVLGLAI